MDGKTFCYSRPYLLFYLKNKKFWIYKLSVREIKRTGIANLQSPYA